MKLFVAVITSSPGPMPQARGDPAVHTHGVRRLAIGGEVHLQALDGFTQHEVAALQHPGDRRLHLVPDRGELRLQVYEGDWLPRPPGLAGRVSARCLRRSFKYGRHRVPHRSLIHRGTAAPEALTAVIFFGQFEPD
jgi:hypothetical protein